MMVMHVVVSMARGLSCCYVALHATHGDRQDSCLVVVSSSPGACLMRLGACP
jgi:hypothetical protein